MIAGRLERRVSAHVDPSDIVQETLIDANRRLDEYLETRAVPFVVWLRQIAAERLIDTYRRHLWSQCRSVAREHRGAMPGDRSSQELTEMLVSGQSSPSDRLICLEQFDQVRAAIDRLPWRSREVLIMRHIEQRSQDEIARVLGISPGAVKARILRATLRLREMLDIHSD